MSAKKEKKDIQETLKGIFKKFPRFTLNTWYFTVVFFAATLVGSIWIWWNCFYSPKPSNSVLVSVEANKEDFDSMKQKTQSAIELLQDKRSKYNNVPDLSQQRELFKEVVEIEEVPIEAGTPIVIPEGEIKATQESPQPSQ